MTEERVIYKLGERLKLETKDGARVEGELRMIDTLETDLKFQVGDTLYSSNQFDCKIHDSGPFYDPCIVIG